MPAKGNYCSFEDAMEYVHGLGLKNAKEWVKYCASGKKPKNIPASPEYVYRDQWRGIGEWLGTGFIANRNRGFRSFERAKEYVHGLGLKSENEWKLWSKSGHRPADIPSSPARVYLHEWIGWGDWLGTDYIATSNREYRPFEEARKYIRELGLRNRGEWEGYCKSMRKPDDIPISPNAVYKDQWRGWGDWLGTGYIASRNREYCSFEDAREYVRGLRLKSKREWEGYCKSERKPRNIPNTPSGVYKDQWRGWGDWLGTGAIATFHHVYRSFENARLYVCGLSLKSKTEYIQWSKSGQRPVDIPSTPERVYRNQWQGWGDWLGTSNIATFNREFMPFEEARAFVRSLHLKNQTAWCAYCKSGKKPDDIPSNPYHVYKDDFKGYGDWLGTGIVANRTHVYRSFEDARAYVRELELSGLSEWREWSKSGQRPIDIPSNPYHVYKDDFKGYGDWLGTGTVATRYRVYRPFEEAREYVRKMGLRGNVDWGKWSSSGQRPADIPSSPSVTYASEWRGWADWVGSGFIFCHKSVCLSFEDARTYVRRLGIKNIGEWQEWCKSECRPRYIPSHPDRVYGTEWRGWVDWWGCGVTKWTNISILAFLESLRPYIDSLAPRELYVILQQGGALPALRKALGSASPMAVLADLKEHNGDAIEQALLPPARDDVLEGELDEEEDAIIAEADDVSLTGNVNDASFLHSPVSLPELPLLQAELRVIDSLMELQCGLDDTAVEYLVNNRVASLWEVYITQGRESVDRSLEGDGGYWFRTIKQRFLEELDGVEHLIIPDGWAYRDLHGMLSQPNAMQKRTAWYIREKRRGGNWSGVGSGKTLSAVLASRVINARLTVIITNNSTVAGWKREITNAYPDSTIIECLDKPLQGKHNYIVLNYEKFQQANRSTLAHQLLDLGIDFLVLDEVQFVKQRDAIASYRREAVAALACEAERRNPSLCVLGMSATPVINNLLEAKKLLEIVTGIEFPELRTTPRYDNAMAMHRALMLYGFRYVPHYEQEIRETIVPTIHNELLHDLQEARGSVLQVEQILLEAKLDAIRPSLAKGTLVYAHYVDGVIADARRYIEGLGYSVGLYMGTDKSGYEPFCKGDVDILLGTSPVGTGLDGLQKVCNRVIFLVLPWTSAEYEQIIGRVRRQGSAFGEVEVIIPQIHLDHNGDIWSWDMARMENITFKRTLSDCVRDGAIPQCIHISPTALLAQSRNALEQWIARVESDGLYTIEHEKLCIPLPNDVRIRAVRRFGDFAALNRKWNNADSQMTHERLTVDPSEWYLYHTLYREARANWVEQPVHRIAERLRVRPDWIIGDFGCGECLLSQELSSHHIKSLDHVAYDERAIACDMAYTPLADSELDVAVFSLSLMGNNWKAYLQEAYRTLKPYGHLFIVESVTRWHDRMDELRNVIKEMGFVLLGDGEQRYDFVYLTAIRKG